MRKTAAFILAIMLLLGLAIPAFAGEAASKTSDLYTYHNEENGHVAVIVDSAHLLTDDEEIQLEEYLNPITAYCDAIFLTSEASHSSSMHEFSKSMLEQIGRSVGMKDGYNAVIYVIDMDQRQLTIYAGETTAKVITTAISNSITDNTYTYATKGDYFSAARETFIQIFQVLEGQTIAQPMRYITSALLALFIGFGISLIMVRIKTKRKKANADAIMRELEVNSFDPVVTSNLVSERTVVHVESSGGGGGGFSGGGGGGGGGGGFSGGGSSGSHGF